MKCGTIEDNSRQIKTWGMQSKHHWELLRNLMGTPKPKNLKP